MRGFKISTLVAWVGSALGISLVCTLFTLLLIQKSRSAVPTAQVAVRSSEGPRIAGGRPARVGKSVTSRGSMQDMVLTLLPKGLRVEGRATLQDFRNTSRYLWGIVIYKESDYRIEQHVKPVFEKIYTDQLFASIPGAILEPTFDDLLDVQLPSGDYIVELSLTWLPPTLDLRTVRDPAQFHRRSAMRARMPLRIED